MYYYYYISHIASVLHDYPTINYCCPKMATAVSLYACRLKRYTGEEFSKLPYQCILSTVIVVNMFESTISLVTNIYSRSALHSTVMFCLILCLIYLPNFCYSKTLCTAGITKRDVLQSAYSEKTYPQQLKVCNTSFYKTSKEVILPYVQNDHGCATHLLLRTTEALLLHMLFLTHNLHRLQVNYQKNKQIYTNVRSPFLCPSNQRKYQVFFRKDTLMNHERGNLAI